MKTSVKLDDELSAEVERAVSLIREDTATVLRMAIRAGLPLVASPDISYADGSFRVFA